MRTIGIVAFLMMLATPTMVLASQGSGTGGDSMGGGVYLSSQGSGTGGDSLNTEIALRSQGSGTGGDSTGANTGIDTSRSELPTSTFAPIWNLSRAFQQYTDKLVCLTNLKCSHK